MISIQKLLPIKNDLSHMGPFKTPKSIKLFCPLNFKLFFSITSL